MFSQSITMIQNYFDNVKKFLGSFISNACTREGLGQEHLPYFARQSGVGKRFCPSGQELSLKKGSHCVQ